MRNHDAIPAISPPPADRDEDGVRVRDLLRQLEPDRSSAGDDLGLIERVHGERTCLGLARVRRDRCLVVVPGNHADVGALLAHAVDLRGGRSVGDEDLGPMAERPSGEGNRQSEVPAGAGDDAGLGHVGGEHLAERAAWLERPGVLEQLELQRERRVEPERPRSGAQGSA